MVEWNPRTVYPDDLPISLRAVEIVAALRQHSVLVIAGETGSGKTTQIPKMCVEAGLLERGKIACTQPRRVAALSISQRIADEMSAQWGQEVGARIRFTDKTSTRTAIVVMTDGMLLNDLQFDPDLREYSAVIIDEAHERSLNIDFILGHLKRLRRRRPDLRIVITSATIDTAAFSKAFDDAPVIEVSGRTWPVDVVYAPVDEMPDEKGDITYIEAMARAVEEISSQQGDGDILCFLPGEKDIREVANMIADRRVRRIEILPLFGRLSNAEQQGIFRPSPRRKVILATNIAETSITIPGIRYVVDSGLVRMSRYHPQSHTLRLPIEKIAQSSAEQRKGRAGRLRDGICIRLYSEQDYLSRPAFTPPEMQRSNLAAVILRLQAFGLGKIETFPLLTPPAPRSIQAGYHLLRQLGAIDEDDRLTGIGKKMARIPVDPTVARIVLQAQREGCLSEICVIAAGMSIQDPRERPSEATADADEMHRKFVDPESDFLTLLNIWNTYHDEVEQLTQSQLRRFCRSHFLNYLRMREWRDVYHQIRQSISDANRKSNASVPSPLNLSNAGETERKMAYRQIHRALLSGLLHGIARRDEGNHYRMAHQKPIDLFPGSTLYDRKAARAERSRKKVAKAPSRTPEWIVCGEVVETSRTFGRMAAGIDPQWILDTAEHLLASRLSEPHYDERGQRVVIRERKILYGLEVGVARRNYLRFDPDDATRIFVREAMVAGLLRQPPAFLEHNLRLREQVEEMRTRQRATNAWTLDDRIMEFYLARIRGVGSLNDLLSFIRRQLDGNDSSLRLSESDLIEDNEQSTNAGSFPTAADFGGLSVPIDYAYKPGEEADGATLKLPIQALDAFQPERLDWIIPGQLKERVLSLLRALPKGLRRTLIPLSRTAEDAVKVLDPEQGALIDQLSQWLKDKHGLVPYPGEWDTSTIPKHLIPRIEVRDDSDRVLSAGRDWNRIRDEIESEMHSTNTESDVGRQRRERWDAARRKHEIKGLTAWSIPDLPHPLYIGEVQGLRIPAYPGLKDENGLVSLRLFATPDEAERHTRRGICLLAEQVLGRELGWLERDLCKELRRVHWLASPLQTASSLEAQCKALIWRHLFAAKEVLPLQKQLFDGFLAGIRERSRGVVPHTVDLLDQILRRWSELRAELREFPEGLESLDGLIHADFLTSVKLERLKEFPRYLRAISLRWQRAKQNPQKDQSKHRQIMPFQRAYNAIRTDSPQKRRLRWLIEEFKVQVFAQELGTREKVSAKILQDQLQKVGMCSTHGCR